MLAGLGTLIGLIARRDRVKVPLIITLFVLSLVSMVPLLKDVYGDEASIDSLYAALGTNPAMLFMTGPIDEASFGGLVTIETLLWWGLAVAFINTLLVVRHTRHNEEIGAQELILSGQTHRMTSLVAVMLAALAINGLLAVGVGLGMQIDGSTWGADQAWLYGLAMGAFGLAWAGVAAVVVQLVESGRSANGLLASLIGFSFVVRGIGDFMGRVDASGLHQPAWISHLSPFGWLQATRPLTEPDWLPLVIPVVFWLAAIVLSLVLLTKRDVGAGLLPSRRGRARASRLLATPLGLTIKLQKNIFTGWLIGVMVMVATIGALVPQMGQIFEGSDSMQQMIEAIGGVGELIPAFMSAMIAISALMVFAYVLQGLGRLRGEEASGHVEQLLSTRLSRIKWAVWHVCTVVVGGLSMLVVVGSGMAIFVNALSDVRVDVGEYVLAALSYAPILLAFVALYLLLFGILPRIAGLVSWLYFGFVAFISWLGPMLGLEDWVMKLSVMEHFSAPPVEQINTNPVIIVSAVSLALIVVGLAVWRQRNLLEK